MTDFGDPRLAPYRDARDADLRGAHGLFLVESARCVSRFLRACERGPWKPVSVLLAPEHMAAVAPLAARVGCPVFEADMESIAAHSGYRFHHGALALGEHTQGPPLQDLLAALPPGPASVLVADGVVHVDNIGALFRNAACLGASAVVLGPGCADPLGRKCIRISMGRVFGVPFATVPDAGAALAQLKQSGFQCVAVEQSPTAIALHDWKPPQRVALLVGAEGRGVQPALLQACDACVEIAGSLDPLAGEGDGPPSLNVSTASAIVLHELRRSGAHARSA